MILKDAGMEITEKKKKSTWNVQICGVGVEKRVCE